MNTIGAVELNRQAVLRSVEIVDGVTVEQLGLFTPCAAWNLGELLGHMTAQHRGFAAAARGDGGDPSAWEVRPLGDDPAGAYAEAARSVVAAFAAEGVMDREFVLPEIRDGESFRASTAIGFHLVDYVVHGWDVAVSIGVRADFPPAVVAAASAVAQMVPTGDVRSQPDSSFAPERETDDGASAMDGMLALLGRDPLWRPSAV
ncbi:TIGR03086 family metal-binding protein [Streptomyces sp. H10-C2]|uniref:TIGR03086 family metal-binding protein n=1 Tax=unclassified Streptomyces TaxID=2593676 RepID=UPI0024B9B294|nr:MULTISPECIES: TIGR03086 family metal-binding protein [unclassified Streptomyces]MDJ0347298.1 TIGR03086 family metal-binding protein [Streptomyces sp. PH10-H1]MDJ0375532.1 TIGR03086 family metal-binding protein [Streptomyces sp. H10-C2]